MTNQRGRGQTEQEFYEEALETAQRGWQATGYGMEINQTMRFDELWKQVIGWESGLYSLLDIGCGTGDVLTYLNKKQAPPSRYVGLDPMKEMVERTSLTIQDVGAEHATTCTIKGCSLDWSTYHGTVGEFWHSGEVVKRGGQFDYAASIAAFALKSPGDSMTDSLAEVFEAIETTMKMVNKAAMFTLFSTWKTEIIPEEMVLDPMMVFSWAKSKWERVDLIHGYAPFDFALVISKEPSPWRREYDRMHGASILRSDD